MILIRIFALVLLCLLPSVSAGASEKYMRDFAAWPVLHDGRVKTLESFSKSTLYQISGETKINGMGSVEWLAVTLFDPAAATTLPIIRVDHIDILDLEKRKPALYTMNEVMGALRPHQDLLIALDSMPPEMFTASQKRLYNLYAAVSVYNQLLLGFSPVIALSGDDASVTYLSAREKMQALQEKFPTGKYADTMPDDDLQDYLLWSRLSLIAEGGRGNTLLRFIPSPVAGAQEPLVSLWETIDGGLGSPVAARITTLLSDMAGAWDKGDFDRWAAVSIQVKNIIDTDPVFTHHYEPSKLWLEHIYVTVNPVLWLIMAYTLVAGFLIAGRGAVAWAFCLGGVVLHILTICVRVYILERPPIATLYETLIFAAAVVIMAMAFVYRRTQNHLLLGGGALAAVILLVISTGFVQGDSFNVLVAVLNTDFWLATHVICIVIGYGACVVAAVTAHFVLLLPYLQSRHYVSDNVARQTATMLLPMTVIALFFTSVGTLLGGIWADQSWGRFWGWDPKENGALLIVLWLAWILHGRVTGHFKKQWFAVTVALTNIPVALTWFGVNLLGVGLHSYGFISGIAYGLAVFCVMQCAVIGLLCVIYKRFKDAS